MRKHLLARKSRLSVAICASVMAVGSQAALEEVVVTAQKREQSLQDVPISLSVVGGKMMEDMGVRDFNDLAEFIPNFFVQDTPGNYAIYIRGMGSTAGNLAFEQTVGLFIDGVYAGKSRQFQNPFLDVERVEILRGPQGALVGKNSSAGAVNVVTRLPTKEPEAMVRTGYEFEGETFSLLGTLSGPLGDNVYGRLAASVTDTGRGHTRNEALGGYEKQVEDRILRGSLLWDASANLEIIAKAEVGRSRIDGNNYETLMPGEKLDYRRSTRGFPGLGERDINDTDSSNLTLTMNYALNDHTLTSITGFSRYDFDKFIDSDFTAANLFGSTFAEDFEQFSQEVRLVSPEGDRFEYAVGAYYHSNDYDLDQSSELSFGPFNGLTARFFQQENEVYSIYAQGTWHLTDTVRISGSGRQTEDDKKARQQRVLEGRVLPSWLDTPLAGKRSESEFDASLTLQWDITADVMMYGTWAEGSKAGGFVGAQANTTLETFEFEPESADTWELGFKGRFPEMGFMFNAAYFYTEYKNLQVSTWDADTSSFITANAAAATSEGVEADAVWSLTDILAIKGSLAYLDASYDTFVGADCLWNNPGCDVTTNDIGGTRLPRSSRWNGTLNLVYEQPLASGMRFDVDLGLVYNSDRYLVENLTPLGRQPGYTKVNLRLALAGRGDKWSLAVVGKNLTDETTFTHAFGTPLAPPGTNTYLVDLPRTLMLQAEYRFF
jgi:iron complex outermembrane recepter protein